MGNSISPHIENAQKTGVCSLKGMKLKELPPEFSKLPATLRTLELSDNQLCILPPKVGQFVNLKSLSVNNNRLGNFPDHINKLLKLETLQMSSNLLTSCILSSAQKMKHLKTVILRKNRFQNFPTAICDLPNVDAVDLSENLIMSIPDDIKKLKAIELNINKNRLNSLPNSLCECPRLKVLRIEENCLPLESLTEDILKKSQISVLAFNGNLFDMKQFQDVDGYEEYIARYSATKKKFV